MDIHERYMHRCLQLAELALGQVASNPMVGAVLVHDNIIIGEGYHQKYGGPHAEVNCINSVPSQLHELISKSTLYVSLEPCTHFGKTPPCTDLIIKSRIPNVVIACMDSFEKVNGTGIQKLKDAGVNVTTGILEQEAIKLNKRFFTFQQEQRPYIILKWAQSNNLKIANADRSPVKISNEITDQLVHKWRSEEAAIMVGTNTAINDDPSLTTRLWPGNNPVRIVIDKQLKIPMSNKIMDNSVSTIILNTMKQEENGNLNYYKIGEQENIIAVTINILKQRSLISLIVEGGTKLLQSFIDAGCWDEARVITSSSMMMENGIDAPRLNKRPFKQLNIRNDSVQFFEMTTR